MTSDNIHTAPILLSPAGSWDSLAAALNAGADAVYFGVGNLNMRSQAAVNFQHDDLPAVARHCHAAGRKAWLTVNIIVYDEELSAMETLLDEAKDAGIDAIIAADPAVIAAAHQRGLPVHLSVQANASNWQTLKFWAPYIDVAVAARELDLEQLQELSAAIVREGIRGASGELLRLEVFVHGALCIGLSGRCGMSLCEYNTSSNRGKCYQPCRRAYLVRDAETGQEFRLENQYIMSPRDLCTIGHLGKLLEAGASVLKIEGRGRSADYVFQVTRCYREAIDMHLRGEIVTAEKLDGWLQALSGVFNRGFWEGGYYLGQKTECWAACEDSQATRRKDFLGLVTNYYAKNGIVLVKLQSGSFHLGESLLAIGPTTGAVEFAPSELQIDGQASESAAAPQEMTVPCGTKLRRGDKIYVLRARQ